MKQPGLEPASLGLQTCPSLTKIVYQKALSHRLKAGIALDLLWGWRHKVPTPSLQGSSGTSDWVLSPNFQAMVTLPLLKYQGSHVFM